MTIKEHPIYRSLFKKEKMLVDIICQPSGKMDIREYWTDSTTEKIYRQGYIKAIDYLHDTKYIFTKCFMRLINFKCFDVEKWNREHDNPDEQLPIDTSYTLNDYLKSQAEKRFRNGMSRAALLNGIDSKFIMIIIIVLVGGGAALFLMNGGL